MSTISAPESVLAPEQTWYSYCTSVTTTGADVPALLLAVIEIDCNWLTSEVVLDVWPFDSVNGMETVNSPPKLLDCVLLNHSWALGPMFTGTVTGVEEDCMVNWNASVERVRVVAYPVTSSVSESADIAETSASVSCTGPEGTERESVTGEAGVTSEPLARAKDGVMVIVPATLPICRPICLLPDGKTACVVPWGIVKSTVCPPLEN